MKARHLHFSLEKSLVGDYKLIIFPFLCVQEIRRHCLHNIPRESSVLKSRESQSCSFLSMCRSLAQGYLVC